MQYNAVLPSSLRILVTAQLVLSSELVPRWDIRTHLDPLAAQTYRQVPHTRDKDLR